MRTNPGHYCPEHPDIPIRGLAAKQNGGYGFCRNDVSDSGQGFGNIKTKGSIYPGGAVLIAARFYGSLITVRR